jgi:hypothetical protein
MRELEERDAEARPRSSSSRLAPQDGQKLLDAIEKL